MLTVQSLSTVYVFIDIIINKIEHQLHGQDANLGYSDSRIKVLIHEVLFYIRIIIRKMHVYLRSYW